MISLNNLLGMYCQRDIKGPHCFQCPKDTLDSSYLGNTVFRIIDIELVVKHIISISVGSESAVDIVSQSSPDTIYTQGP